MTGGWHSSNPLLFNKKWSDEIVRKLSGRSELHSFIT